MENMNEKLTKIFNGLNEVEVKGSNNVMILGQIMFDLGTLIQQFEQEEKEKNAEEINE